jgi:putative membrane protein
MYEWITITAYPWIKALHVIAVISWMAGMLYLPRLFVYHCEAEVGSKQSETFQGDGMADCSRRSSIRR